MKNLKQIAYSALIGSRKAILAVVQAFCRAAPASDISIGVQLAERSHHVTIDCSQQLARLLSSRVTMLDVGARGGLLPPFQRYAKHLDAILVEPDPVEAEGLRSSGFRVIDKALGSGHDKAVLHITRQPGASSLLSPDGPFMDFYAHGTSRYEVLKTVELETTTLSDALAPMVDRLDLLKLDTQGTELDILKGMGVYRPLFIQTEVAMLPIYTGQCMMWDVMAHLWPLGYMPFNFYISFVSPGPRAKFRPSLSQSYRGLPVGGDILLMPDWTRAEGRALIQGREKEFAALCLMFGMENILRYVLGTTDMQAKGEILKAL